MPSLLRPKTETGAESKSNDEPKLTYTQKLVASFEDTDDTKSYSFENIKAHIENFSAEHRAKAMKKTDQMPFGKYKHKKVKAVAAFDMQYFNWLLKQDMMENYPDLKLEIEKYL